VPDQGNSFDCGVRVLHAISEIVASPKICSMFILKKAYLLLSIQGLSSVVNF
jgi:Ulp1 family protease